MVALEARAGRDGARMAEILGLGLGCAGSVADGGHSVGHQRDAVLHDSATQCAVS